jgi:hypothetical protein
MRLKIVGKSAYLKKYRGWYTFKNNVFDADSSIFLFTVFPLKNELSPAYFIYKSVI